MFTGQGEVRQVAENIPFVAKFTINTCLTDLAARRITRESNFIRLNAQRNTFGGRGAADAGDLAVQVMCEAVLRMPGGAPGQQAAVVMAELLPPAGDTAIGGRPAVLFKRGEESLRIPRHPARRVVRAGFARRVSGLVIREAVLPAVTVLQFQ